MERYYPFEHKEEKEREKTAYRENVRYPEHTEQPAEGKKEETGKGRRGGNSAISRVLHSGNVTKRTEAINARRSAQERSSETESDHQRRESSFRNGRAGTEKSSARRNETERNDLRGRRLALKVSEHSDVGCFLETEDGKRILLPFAEQTRKPDLGETIQVSIYEDKGGRLTATMREPVIEVGNTGVLPVAAVTKIGAFADNGMPKQVLIPFKEMLHTPMAGEDVLLFIYLDKSGRQAGTMRVYRHLRKDSPYQEGDHVEGFVYEIKPGLGAFVAVDDTYYGLIPERELFTELKYGDRVTARVSKVREDGKLDLLLREKLYMEVDKDAEFILRRITENGGILPYADKADADMIRREFSMSKNQFKRALGALYKKRLIEIDREKDMVRLL